MQTVYLLILLPFLQVSTKMTEITPQIPETIPLFNDSIDNTQNHTLNISEEEEYEYYDYDIEESFLTFDWSELGPSLVVFGLTFIIGILGNCLILIAVIRHTHVKKSPVNVFLGSLASADLLLILICLPLKVSIILRRILILTTF